MTDTDTAARAQRLRDLHAAPEILRVVNVHGFDLSNN